MKGTLNLIVVPQNTTDLYVFNSTINIQGNALFTGYSQVTYLDIKNSNVNLIAKPAFEYLTNLKVLDLCNNQMTIFIAEVRNLSHNLLSTYQRESWSY